MKNECGCKECRKCLKLIHSCFLTLSNGILKKTLCTLFYGSDLSINILHAGDKSPVQRGFSKIVCPEVSGQVVSFL